MQSNSGNDSSLCVNQIKISGQARESYHYLGGGMQEEESTND
jgi:hypothetical protein